MGDYPTYKNIFLQTNITHIYNTKQNTFEYLYEVISAIVRSITSDYRVLRFVLAVICFSFLYRIIVNEGELAHSFTILMAYWALNFGNIFIIRSTIATTICVYSIRYIEKKDFKKVFLLTAIATLFHSMAIIWLVSYFLYRIRMSRKTIVLGIILATVFNQYLPLVIDKVSLLFGSYYHTKVISYLSRGTGALYGQNYSMFFLFAKAFANGLVLIVLYLFIIHNIRDELILERINGQFTIYLFGFFIQICTLNVAFVLARMTAPFIAMQFFAFSYLFKIKYKSIGDKVIVHTVLSLYLLLRMIVSIRGADYIPFTIMF